MEEKEYIIGVDIGSSNVVMAVGTRNDRGDISVLGVEVQKVENCVKDGDVTNHILLGNAIKNARVALENDLNIRLNSAYVGISGRSTYCVRYEDYVDINEPSGCVTDAEIVALKERIDMATPAGGDKIIGSSLLCYKIDDQVVADPIGAYGRKLSALYLFVMVSKEKLDRVDKAMFHADMKVCGWCVNPTLLPDLLLTSDEKEAGVAIIDMGSDLTDIAVVREGKLCYFSSLPIGSSSINNDLYEFLKVPKKDIDNIKHRYGSAIAGAVPEDVAIQIKTAGNTKKQILQRNIAEIAEERLKDVADFILRELKAAKFVTRIPCGVVLTGGAAYLDDIDKLFARELNMQVRFGDILNGLDDESQQIVCANPQSVALALLLYGSKHNACQTAPQGLVREVVPPVVENEKADKPKEKKPFVPPTYIPSVEYGNNKSHGLGTNDNKSVAGAVKTEPIKPVEPPKQTSNPVERVEPVHEPVKEQVKEQVNGPQEGTGKTELSGGKVGVKPSHGGNEAPTTSWGDRIRRWLDNKFSSDDNYL